MSVLDIGSGIRPQSIINDETWCVEPHHEYVAVLMEMGLKVLAMTWEQALSVLAPKSFDHVTILDVLEHIEKEKALELLARTETVARSTITLNTPQGFVSQDPGDGGLDAWGLHGGEWQRHVSGFEPEDFPGWNISFQSSDDNEGNPITQMWVSKAL